MGGRPRVVVLDYGSGNLRSAERAVARAGADVTVSADADLALSAAGLVVPGVGAFAACMGGLRAVRGEELVRKRLAAGRPVLGICVGMQVLFEEGVEHGVRTPGFAAWPGVVERLRARIVPHMGWNTVAAPAGSRLLAGVEDQRFYFVHSYGVRRFGSPAGEPGAGPEPLLGWTCYDGDRCVATVEDGILAATQFHPEKSGDAGAQLLRNWVRTLER